MISLLVSLALLAPQDLAGPGAATVKAPDGVAIAYSACGAGETALVFIHGWGCSQEHWREQVPAFREEYCVVTLDLPGHGKSGWQERKEWHVGDFGKDVQAVVEELELGRVILVGHSMGGPVALRAAALMPERVIGVVGADTLQDVDQEWDPQQAERLVAAMEADFDAFTASFVRMMFASNPDVDPELVEWVVEDVQSRPHEPVIGLMRDFGSIDQAGWLAACPVPVRCVNAGFMQTDVEGNRAHKEDFQATILPNVGHFVMLEKPTEFNEAMSAYVAALAAP